MLVRQKIGARKGAVVDMAPFDARCAQKNGAVEPLTEEEAAAYLAGENLPAEAPAEMAAADEPTALPDAAATSGTGDVAPLVVVADAPTAARVLEVRHVGRGRFAVFSGEERLTTEPYTKQEAEEAAAKMAAL